MAVNINKINELNAVRLSDLTTYEFKEALENIEVAIIPVGSTEQHSSNTTLNTDTVLAEEVAVQTARLMQNKAIVVPSIPIGISYHHMSWPGTMTFSPNTLQYILIDYIKSLKKHGISRFVLLNGHGGNKNTLSSITQLLRYDYEVHVLNIFYWDLATTEIKAAAHTNKFGHACEIETSFAKYLAPQIVREKCLKASEIKNYKIEETDSRNSNYIEYPYYFEELTEDGSFGDARLANFKDGENLITLICERIRDVLEKYIREMKINSLGD